MTSKILVLYLIISSILFGQQTNFLNESKSEYKIDDVKYGTGNTVINSRYLPFTIYPNSYIIHETITSSIEPGWEGRSGNLSASCYLLNKSLQIDKKIWEITDKAHNSVIDKGFYSNYYNGCCGAEITYSYHNLESGKKVFSATSKNLIYNSAIRDIYISYQSISSSKDFPRQLFTDQLCGIITISFGDSSLLKVMIYSEDALTEYSHTPNNFLLVDRYNNRDIEIYTPKSIYEFEDVDTLNIFMNFYGAEIYLVFSNGIYQPKESKINNNFWISISKDDVYLYENRFYSLDNQSKQNLRLLRNEIFARHGQSFKSDDLKNYFSKKIWYTEKPNYNVKENELTKNEKLVLSKIVELE